MFKALFLILSVVSAGIAVADDEAQQKSSEEIVITGIKRMDEQLRSADTAVRERACDEVMPDRKLFETWFGDDAKLVWTKYEEGLKLLRDSTAKAKAELDTKGALKDVRLVDLRGDGKSARVTDRFREVLGVIPREVPIYQARFTYENGALGASTTYVVVDGKMIWIRGLEEIPRHIAEEKQAVK